MFDLLKKIRKDGKPLFKKCAVKRYKIYVYSTSYDTGGRHMFKLQE